MKELDVRDEDAVAISPGEEAVRVGHVNDRAAFHAVFFFDVEADVVLHVEFKQAFVVLEWEAEYASEDKAKLVVGVHHECWVDEASWGVAKNRVGESVIKTCPVG